MATTAHPGNDYYVSATGTIQAQSNPVLAAGLKAAGWLGPYDWTQAKAVANQGIAGKVGQAVGTALPTSNGPATGAAAGNTAQTTATNAVNSVGSSISSVENFLQGLTTKNLWIRVAKVTVGGVILIVGLAKLTGIDSQVKVLGKAVEKAPLL